MVNPSQYTRVPAHRAGQYRNVAESLYSAAEDLATLAGDESRKKLQAILRAKEEVSYMGEYYREEQALTLLTKLRAYRRWAREVYERRP